MGVGGLAYGLCALGQGQARLEAGCADSKRVTKWAGCPRMLGVRWARFYASPFSPVSFTVPACFTPSLSPIPLFLLSVPFFLPFFIFLPSLCFPFTLSLSRPHPRSYCGNNSMPEIKAGSS